MADTVRTRSYLATTSFPNNITGDISAQDIRDFLASILLTSELGDIVTHETSEFQTAMSPADTETDGYLSASDHQLFSDKATTNPMSASGDIIIGGTDGTLNKLVKDATDGKVLTSKSGLPSWQTLVGGLASSDDSYEIVVTGATAIINGTNLLAAYDAARDKLPGGNALSHNNRAVVYLPPGKYDLGTTPLELDTEYVDLMGLSDSADNVKITSQIHVISSGTVMQTAQDVQISNLTIDIDIDTYTLADDNTDPAAYFPDSFPLVTDAVDGAIVANANEIFVPYNITDEGDIYASTSSSSDTYTITFSNGSIDLGSAIITNAGKYLIDGMGYAIFKEASLVSSYTGIVIRASGRTICKNVNFTSQDDTKAWPMRVGVEYSGTFENCTSGIYGFGTTGTASGTFISCNGGAVGFGGGAGIANGTFILCQGTSYSFGGDGTASGTFTDCVGITCCFGGNGGIASGIFTNCIHIGNDAFGGIGGTASGVFVNCQTGNDSFCSDTNGTAGGATGIFRDCIGGNNSFGGISGTASGTFTNCTAGDYSFGGGIASGTFTNCKGEDYSFGGNTGAASGIFINCRGDLYSFGGSGEAGAGDGPGPAIFRNCTGLNYSFGGNGGTASGTFESCTGGDYSFGGDNTGGGGTASGIFRNCTGGDYSFAGLGTANGTFQDCTGEDYSFGGNTGATGGTFTNCTGGDYSFAGSDGSAYGIFMHCTGGIEAFGGSDGEGAYGSFIDCIGGAGSFGGHGGTASGLFTDCIGGIQSFGGDGGDASGYFFNCKMGTITNHMLTVGVDNWGGSFSGLMDGCYWEVTGTDKTALAISQGSIYNSTIKGTGSGKSIGGAGSVAVAHCRLNKGIATGDVTNTIGTNAAARIVTIT